MRRYIYIVKHLAPWMIDELVVISIETKFELILLRNPSNFYDEALKRLKKNGVIVHIRPYSKKLFVRKLFFGLKFLAHNISSFGINYNGVIGIRSLWWFCRIDTDIFDENTSLHAQFSTQPAVFALLIKKFFNNKPEFTFTFHAYDIYFNNKWFPTLVRACSKAYSISNYNINYVRKKFIDSEKIELSRLGVFREEYIISDSQKQMEKQITIGLMSWFVEKKGIIYLLKAFDALDEPDRKRVKLKLAGDGPLKESLLNFIEENDLEDSIDYLGKINESDRKYFYSDIDIFVMPSIKLKNDQDGIPVVLMEAIASGLPLIGTNVSGISEICIDDYNGFLINQKSHIELKRGIKKFLDSKDLYNKFSQNSLQLSNEYDIYTNTKGKLKSMHWV